MAGLLILRAALELAYPERTPSQALLMAPWLALGLLSLGMGALFLDLGHKLHVYRFYLAFRILSPMSWGSWILLGVYPVTALVGLLSLRDVRWLRRNEEGPAARISHWIEGRRRTILWASLGLGLALGIYTGLLLGTMAARPLWNSALLGPLFLVSGLSTGAAFLMLLPLAREERHILVKFDLLAIGVELAVLALLLIGLGGGPLASQAAAGLLLGGPYTGPFWSLVVATGLVVPAGLELVELRLKLRPTIWSPLLILIGGLWLRYILVAAGQAAPLSHLL